MKHKTDNVDVILIGTGLAPLVAASQLIQKHKKVLILNPDLDFFLEDSELPLDPEWPFNVSEVDREGLNKNRPQELHDVLSPGFPGSVEILNYSELLTQNLNGFKDKDAPFIRSRSRLWIQSRQTWKEENPKLWGKVEEIFLHASEAGLRAQELEGMAACKRFPGFSGKKETDHKAVLIPQQCDVDHIRYRMGYLEYIRDRIGKENVLCGVNSLELNEDGVSFYHDSFSGKVKASEGVLVYWTPRMNVWVMSNVKQTLSTTPKSIQNWEKWTLISKENLDPSQIGVFEEMAVWAELEGVSFGKLRKLNILRKISEVPFQREASLIEKTEWCSEESFQSISRLTFDFLRWDKFSVQSIKTNTIFEVEPQIIPLKQGNLNSSIVLGVDGPLVDVVIQSRLSSESYT